MVGQSVRHAPLFEVQKRHVEIEHAKIVATMEVIVTGYAKEGHNESGQWKQQWVRGGANRQYE